jgi:hypothetical protein
MLVTQIECGSLDLQPISGNVDLLAARVTTPTRLDAPAVAAGTTCRPPKDNVVPETIASAALPDRTVASRVNYIGQMSERPRYYAHDSSRDVITFDRRTILVEDARLRSQPPSLGQEGFALFQHPSAVADFLDPEELARVYSPEIERLVMEVSGADQAVISGPVILRSSEKSPVTSPITILRPARFVHIDISDSTVAQLTERWRPKNNGRVVRRFAHYNVWRALTPPPQDIPLAVCDARTVCQSDPVDADSITDTPGEPVSSIVVGLVRYNPLHRWSYFSEMNRDEVLVFKSHDSDPNQPHHVPHTAFKDAARRRGVATRESIEMRAIAFWIDS